MGRFEYLSATSRSRFSLGHNLFFRNEKRLYPSSTDSDEYFTAADFCDRPFSERNIADTFPRLSGIGVTAHHRASAHINFVANPEWFRCFFCSMGFQAYDENQQHAEDQQKLLYVSLIADFP